MVGAFVGAADGTMVEDLVGAVDGATGTTTVGAVVGAVDGAVVGSRCIVCFCFCFWSWRLLGGSFSFLSPSKTSRNNSIAVNVSIGALFGCCLMASSSCLVASSILSAGVRSGMTIA